MNETKVFASEKEVLLVGQILSGKQNQKAINILENIFGSRLSYTRGDSHHTAFLEGQRSVIQFIKGAAKAAQRKAEEDNE